VEHQLWKAIVTVLATLDKKPVGTRSDYSDERIVQVYYWAVIHDRPTAWACRRENWPLHLRRHPLPSPSRMSRRLRSPSVVALLAALERRALAPTEPGLFWVIDGKPLPIGGCSKDRQAGYGRAAGGKAKGYKVHAIIGAGGIAAWRLAPMNTDERVTAARLVRAASIRGYLVADSDYDSNPLHAACDRLGELQLVARRRRGAGTALGHHRHTPGRLRSVERTENPFPHFADQLLRDRAAIERAFGNWVNRGGGLTALPPWVRTHRRVHRWVQAKLVLAALKRPRETPTCAA
jgi:hypothetical protein